MVWENTPTAILQRRMQEIALQVQKELEGLPEEDIKVHIIEKVNERSHRVFFEKKFLTNESKVFFHELNTKRSGGRVLSYGHLDNGFSVAIAPEFVEGETPFLDNDNVLHLWAHARTMLWCRPRL